jgi:hypothetical protein
MRRNGKTALAVHTVASPDGAGLDVQGLAGPAMIDQATVSM